MKTPPVSPAGGPFDFAFPGLDGWRAGDGWRRRRGFRPGGRDASPICDSGISVDDPDVAQRLGDSCCDQFNECSVSGTDGQGCVDCFNAGRGAQCDDAIDCAATECNFP